MDQERQNVQSTKQQNFDNDSDAFPTDSIGNQTYEYASIVLPLTPKLKAFLDITGHFPNKSLQGNKYLYVMYNFDANEILSKPIPNRQAKTLVDAWTNLHTAVSQHGHPTKHFVLDNKISEEFKQH
eukprot:15057328-Ditylum_brightwellii.AAC.2